MKLAINHKSPIPLHIQAEELLRQMIQDPEYKGGKILPNEVELSKQLAISRTTLRQAINKLVFEGLLIRKKKTGTKVAAMPVSSKSNNWLSFSQEMKLRGITIRNFELHITWVKPDDEIARFFEIKKDKMVLRMEKVRGRPEEPFVYFVSYFHPRIGLTGEEDFHFRYMKCWKTSIQQLQPYHKEEISAQAAYPDIAKKLRLHEGSPILFRKRFVFDQGQRRWNSTWGITKQTVLFIQLKAQGKTRDEINSVIHLYIILRKL